MSHLNIKLHTGTRPLHIEEGLFRDDPKSAVAYLLTDLRHFCDQHGHDFDEAVALSETYYQDDKIEGEVQA